MGPRDNETLKAAPEANGSHEMMEMHLFDDNARKENALLRSGHVCRRAEERGRLRG